MTSATALACQQLSSVFISQRVKSKCVRFQVRRAQSGSIRIRKLDLEESVVTNEDDVIVRRRIKFVGGVFGDNRISTGMESGQGK